MNFETVYVYPNGRTSQREYVGALITLLAAVAFYALLVKGRNGQWSLLTMLFPAVVLHARRLHDMGKSAWLLLAPGGLIALSLLLRMVANGTTVEVAVTIAAIVAAAACCVVGLVGKGEGAPNRFGEPAPA